MLQDNFSDLAIMDTLDRDFDAQNEVAVGLALADRVVTLPNLFDENGNPLKIDPRDGLSPGELYAIGRSASNTETKDQALTIMSASIDRIKKQMLRDAKNN
jgi:hypothetical protein